MATLRILIFFLICSASSITMVSCGHRHQSESPEAHQGKEYASAYICPMHCEGSGSDQPGTCPKCGMEYEKNKEYKSDGHEQPDSVGQHQ